MLLKRQVLDRIAAGELDLVFRRWKRPTVKTGGTLKTAVGELAIESVRVVTLKGISDADAKRAGYPGRAALLAELRQRQGKVYRIAVAFAGEDPRVALRSAPITREEADAVDSRLPWARTYLQLIEAQPGVRAADLAAQIGQQKAPFKQRVRRLKAGGLTESLDTGYQLSKRGRALLRHLR